MITDEERRFVRDGVGRLTAVCDELHGLAFVALSAEQRELALRALERDRLGSAWLAEQLDFVLEALLGDPSYGGNPAGVGWRWLGIRPGFPLPPGSGAR